MDVNGTIALTDKILNAVGITRSDIDVIVLVAIVVTGVLFFLFRQKCKGTVTCHKIDRAMTQVNSLSGKIEKMHDMHVSTAPKLDRIDQDHEALSRSMNDLKADISLLRGIIAGTGQLGNRRIIHDR